MLAESAFLQNDSLQPFKELFILNKELRKKLNFKC